ncbi:peptidyl-prolyl cis-trans isomerase [Desulfurivibrio sp. D14AmB]|uniref:peptidylprolyl isomerase n=1 Tax=Desulfurivibrio sp. D14AmB TaxID=3374370 RepID=UPI00376EA9A1
MAQKGFAGLSKYFLGLICCVLLAAAGLGRPATAQAWFWGERPLAVVNGEEFSADDFRNWWRNWREPGMARPTSPDAFIQWQLLAQEAERMQLFQEPDFRRRVAVFLRVRSLMMLKEEEIDGVVSISEGEIQEEYRAQYTPRLRAHSFFYSDEESAALGAAALRSGARTVDGLLELEPEAGRPVHHEERWVRLTRLPEEWRGLLAEAEPGQVVGPLAVEHGAAFIRVEERTAGDPQDLERVRAGIVKDLRTRKSHQLTAELVEKLQEKFAVQIDREVLELIGPEPPSAELAERVLISTSQGDIVADDLWRNLRGEQAFREKNRFEAEEFAIMKERVLANMISQTLVSWEALDRNYQERPPLKELYDFYRRHRLIKELERRLVEPAAAVTEEEIVNFLAENSARFSRPESVSFMLLEGESEVVERMGREIASGRDFSEVATRHLPGGPPVQRLPLDHLDAELAAALADLRQGEVSRPFPFRGHAALLRLVNRTPATTMPLEAVRQSIEEELSEAKFRQAREDLVNLLTERSEIRVNQRVWNTLNRELEKEDVSL